jgi:hypothetical protein
MIPERNIGRILIGADEGTESFIILINKNKILIIQLGLKQDSSNINISVQEL